MKGRIAKFKINPGKSNPFKPSQKHYFNVHIFDTKDNLQSAGYKISKEEKNRVNNYHGVVIPRWNEKLVEDEWVASAKLGDVLFHKEFLNTNVITHESVHVATSFLRVLNKLKLDNEEIDDGEELLAYSIGSICSQIVVGLYDARILNN